MKLSTHELETLLELVEKTRNEEIDCDQFLERVAPFLERRRAAGEVPRGFEAVQQHLGVCPECKEEFEALLQEMGGA